MQFVRNLILAFLFCLQFSCIQKEPIENDRIDIRNTEKDGDLILNPVKLVYLKPNPFAPIGGIEKVLAIGNRLIIFDGMVGNAIFIFDNEGNYINHIHRVGEGPGEYKNIENIFYDPFQNSLILIPMDFNRKIFFDLDGNYLGEDSQDLPFYFSDWTFMKSGELILNNSPMNGMDNFQVFKNGAAVQSAIPYAPIFDNTPVNKRNLISNSLNENYLFSVGSRDTIFSFQANSAEIKPEFIFDFKNPISLQEFGTLENPLSYFLENDLYLGILDLFQNKDFLSFSTLNSKGLKGRILDKNTKKLYDTEAFLKKDIGDIQFKGILGITEQNYFISVITSNDKGVWGFSKNKHLNEEFSEFEMIENEDLMLLIFSIEGG